MAEPAKKIWRLPGKAKGRVGGSAFGGLVWVAAVSDATDPDVARQAADLFAKLERMLAEMGSDKSRIISATVYLADLSIKSAFDDAWVAWVGENHDDWPQRTCVGADLVKPYLVEIKLLAAEA